MTVQDFKAFFPDSVVGEIVSASWCRSAVVGETRFNLLGGRSL